MSKDGDGKPSPFPRHTGDLPSQGQLPYVMPRLKPAKAAHRAQPKSGGEQIFEATQGRNRRASLPERYGKKYEGKHRKKGKGKGKNA